MNRERLGWIIGGIAVAVWLATCAAVLLGETRLLHSAKANPAIESIKEAEGFRGMPYRDTHGNLTLGYGTKLPITQAEGEMLLLHRLEIETRCIAGRWPPWETAAKGVRVALQAAAYQLGCAGLLEFKKALSALATGDYAGAAREFRRSDWYRETPSRVERVIRTFQQ